MRKFWFFRSNLKALEYYHEFKDLDTFIRNCHDYYMLLPLWLLQADYFDEVIVWRLTDKKRKDIVFDVNGKKFIQRWVTNFNKTYDYDPPQMSFWRGGFQEYDRVTAARPERFGFKIYLGAGQRINAAWGGKYDLFLMEDDDDLRQNPGTHPFYKTASPFVFHNYQNTIVNLAYDICWPCNFTQIRYKGQEDFIRAVAQSEMLSRLSIAHCGNKPNVGRKMCEKYGVTNIKFHGLLDKKGLNNILNHSRFGLNMSNRKDGCPRVSTEILMSGTPLIIHERTRLLSFYKKRGVVEVNDKNIGKKIISAIEDYTKYKTETYHATQNELSFDQTNQKNIDLWKSLAKI